MNVTPELRFRWSGRGRSSRRPWADAARRQGAGDGEPQDAGGRRDRRIQREAGRRG